MNIIFRIFFIFLLGALLLAAFLPTFLSSSWAKEHLILPYLHRSYPGSFSFQRLQLSWLNKQALEGFEFKDTQRKNRLSIDQLETDRSLWQLLSSRSLLGKWILKGKTFDEEANEGTFEILASVEDASPSLFFEKIFQRFFSPTFSPLKGVQVEAEVKRFPIALLDQFTFLHYPGKEGTLSHLLGKELNISIQQTDQLHLSVTSEQLKVTGSAQWEAEKTDSAHPIMRFQMAIEHPLLETFIEPSLHVEGDWMLNPEFSSLAVSFSSNKLRSLSPFYFHCTHKGIWLQKGGEALFALSPLFLQNLSPSLFSSDLHLQHEVPVRLQLTSFAFPFSSRVPFSMEGVMHADTASFLSSKKGEGVTLEHVEARFSNTTATGWDFILQGKAIPIPLGSKIPAFLGKDLLFQMQSHVDLGSNTSSLSHIKGSLSSERGFLNLKGDLSSLTLPYVQAQGEFNLPPEGAALFGKKVEIKGKWQASSENSGLPTIAFQLKGEAWHGQGTAVFNEGLQLDTPMILEWTLTPERFSVLRERFKTLSDEPPLVLQNPVKIAAQIFDIYLPPSYAFSLAKGRAEITVEPLHFYEPISGIASVISGIHGTLTTSELGRLMETQWTAQAQTSVSWAAVGQMSTRLSIEHLTDSNGDFHQEEVAFTLDGEAMHVPATLLGNVLQLGTTMQSQVHALIGDAFNAKVHANLKNQEGSITTTLQGTQGSLFFDGHVQKGFLFLTQPLELQTKVTPELSHTVLQELVPFLSAARSADQPIRIRMEPDGFAVPIEKWDISQVRFNRAIIDLGKVYFRPEGQLGQLLSVLRYQNPSSDPLNIWFTPLYTSMNHGEIKIERMDMLVADAYPLAIWGIVNFIEDRVQMTIGLGSQALRKAFNIRGFPEDSLLQLSLKGTLANASIDKTKATAKITTLIAKSQGFHGTLVGGILDLVGIGFTEKTPPPPTTSPFPWQTKDEAVEEQQPLDQTKRKKIESSLPLKVIEKGTRSLFKLFR